MGCCISAHPVHSIRAAAPSSQWFSYPPRLSNLIHTSRPPPLHTCLPTPSSHQRKLFSLLTSQGIYCLYQLVPNICHLIICSLNFSANKCLGLCLDCKFLEERWDNFSPSLYYWHLTRLCVPCWSLTDLLGINESMNKWVDTEKGNCSEKIDSKKQGWFNMLSGLWTDIERLGSGLECRSRAGPKVFLGCPLWICFNGRGLLNEAEGGEMATSEALEAQGHVTWRKWPREWVSWAISIEVRRDVKNWSRDLEPRVWILIWKRREWPVQTSKENAYLST